MYKESRRRKPHIGNGKITNRGNRSYLSVAGATAALALGAFVLIACSINLLFAQSVPPPVLRIAPTGTNQFLITITNASASTNYEIQRSLAIGDPAYPFEAVLIGTVGQSNFTVDMGIHTLSFFRANLGLDADADGTPNWADPQPLNGTVSNLVITIDSPTNGANLN